MQTEEKLPYRIIRKACEMFGESTGLTYAEMSRFFCYELNKSPEEIGFQAGDNRSETFGLWLSLFPIDKQKALLLRLCKDDIPMYHGQPSEEKRSELIKALAGCAMDEVVSESLTEFSYDGITEYWTKALERRTTDPEGAITIARTLLETVCKHILDDMQVSYDSKDDLPKLYRKVAEKLNLTPEQHAQDVFKRILGGCFSIIEGLGSLRNQLSDAHGKGRRKIKPASRHAEFAVNLAGTTATFLLRTWEIRQQEQSM
jgi:hypothetical protein